MTASVLQEVATTTITSSQLNTIAATFGSTCTVGSTFEVYISQQYNATANVPTSVTDNYNSGGYTLKATSSSSIAWAYMYVFQNNQFADPITVTVSWAGGPNSGESYSYPAIWLKEIGGVTTTSFQVALINGQAAPGTATDAITTGNMTPTSQPALISALAGNDNGSTPAPAAGTGYTAGITSWSSTAQSESKRITSTSAVAATFTDATYGGSDNYMTMGAIYTEATGGGSNTATLAWIT